jgi:hypothetical protein
VCLQFLNSADPGAVKDALASDDGYARYVRERTEHPEKLIVSV